MSYFFRTIHASSAGHLLSVAGILAFFIMIYDSIRQAKPSIRNNFGAGRLNTRLGFYFFEINRLSFIQRKTQQQNHMGSCAGLS